MALISQLGRVFVACTAVMALATCSYDYSARRAAAPALLPERTAPALQAAVAEAAPPVEPVSYEALTTEQAILHNAALAAINDPGPAARPFVLAHGADYDRAVDCLASAIYYEAASETAQGQRAVAQVVLNRVRHPAFPKTICGVVYQGAERSSGCQFTFTCDGSLAMAPVAAGWSIARRIAAAALSGSVESSIGEATHYHADRVVPYWADSLTRATTIGAHIFFRWPGYWGTPAAFNSRYATGEPAVAALLGRAVAAVTPQPATKPASSPKLVAALALDDAAVMASAPLRTLKADLDAGGLKPALNRRLMLQADLNKPRLLADERAAPASAAQN